MSHWRNWNKIQYGFGEVIYHETLKSSAELIKELNEVRNKFPRRNLMFLEFPDTEYIFDIIRLQKPIIKKYENLQQNL